MALSPALLKMGAKMGGSNGAKAGLSLATGLLQNIQANKLKKQAEAAMPDLIDPSQSSFLAELGQKRKAIETGAEYTAGINEADSAQASANDAIVNASGGNTGATIQGLLQAQGVAGRTKNQSIAQGQTKQLAYNTAFSNLLNDISARQLELKLLDRNQKLAEWSKKKQFANQNINAGLASLLSGGKGSGATPTQSAPTETAQTAPVNTKMAGMFDESNLMNAELGPNFNLNGL